MRVGLFIDHFDPAKGGLETALAHLAHALTDAGHEAFVYCLSAAENAPGRHRVISLSASRRGELERALAAKSLAAAHADECDVTLAVRHCPDVDVYWPHGGSHAATLAAGEASKGGAAGAVSRLLHHVSPRHRVFLDLERAALTGGARKIWCVSQLVRDELAAAYPACADRLEVHPNGVDRDAFSPGLRAHWRTSLRAELAVPAGAPLLLFMGGNLRLKGWDVLRAALSRSTDVAWACVVAGADVATVERDARAAGIGERVIAIPRHDAATLFGGADLLVQPTFRDPCSLATLESLAAGVPVLTTTANGAADALVDPVAGQAVSAGDVDAFSSALRYWIVTVADSESRAASALAARRCTTDRDVGPWLTRMVSSLASLAALGR